MGNLWAVVFSASPAVFLVSLPIVNCVSSYVITIINNS